jgi:flagellar export protein FliJ
MRRRVLEEKQRELARAEEDLAAAQRRETAASDSLHEARGQAHAAMQGPQSPGHLAWYRFWLLRLEFERREKTRVSAGHAKAVAAARTSLTEARQQVEALERLRRRAVARQAAVDAARERQAIDELATIRHAHTMRAQGAGQ